MTPPVIPTMYSYTMPKTICPICSSEATCFHTGITHQDEWGYEDHYYLKCPKCSWPGKKPGRVMEKEDGTQEVHCPFCNALMSTREDYMRNRIYDIIRTIAFRFYWWEFEMRAGYNYPELYKEFLMEVTQELKEAGVPDEFLVRMAELGETGMADVWKGRDFEMTVGDIIRGMEKQLAS